MCKNGTSVPEVIVIPPGFREITEHYSAPGDWLNSLTSAERKEVPIFGGLMQYFPDALAAVAHHSYLANEKHNPGEPLHWSREKSGDHEDCIARHLANVGTFDNEGMRHSVSLAWRALALLQLEIEAAHARGEIIEPFNCNKGEDHA